jgi:hypothetical protein
MILISCSPTHYEEADTDTFSKFEGYFTVIKSWDDGYGEFYHIMYANDTKVLYFYFGETGSQGGITPLYNADGSLQIYSSY